MKTVLLASALFASLAALPVRAAQFWYDVITNYPGGCISTNSDGLWYAHPPGSMTAKDILIVTNSYTSGAAVSGKMLRVNGLNSEYVMRLFDPINTNSVTGGTVYASFIANANYVPAAGKGTYFACFNSVVNPSDGGAAATNGFDFRGRVYEIGNTNAWPYTNTVSLTYRFGLSNFEGDPAQPNPGPNVYVPIDLIKNVDYQVVLKYDIDNAVAYLWVNPASESDTANGSGPTSDLGAVANGLAGLLFRQRTGGGTVDVRDVVVGTTFADVMTNTACGPVMVATNYNMVTNYAGNPALLEVFSSSIGGGPLSYQWYQIAGGNSNAVPGATSQTCLLPSLSGSDAGNYCCVVANACGSNAVSTTNFYISVNTTPTPPFFTVKPPATVNGAIAAAITLTAAASGTGPISYQWTFNGTPLVDGAPVTSGDGSVVSGSQTPTLTVRGLSTNDTGNFQLTVTSGGPVSPNTTNVTTAVTVLMPHAVTIAYIRSLEDNTTWQVTDTTSLLIVSNAVVTTYTNLTSGTTSSYYIQDATGGLDLFVTGGNTFRPQMGDIVAACGTLSMYNNALELDVTAGGANEFYTVTAHTNLLPAPVVFSLPLTNNAGLMETNLEGRICMLTNVWFTFLPSIGTFNYNTYVTNAGGGAAFNVFFPAGQDPDLQNQTLSTLFAYTITGVLTQYKSGGYGSSGYELDVTRIGDVETNPPPAVTVTASVSGNDVVLTWTAVPYTIDTRGAYAYSVLSATDVGGPYLPLATGLAFNTTNGVYTDTNAVSGAQKFYRISSP